VSKNEKVLKVDKVFAAGASGWSGWSDRSVLIIIDFFDSEKYSIKYYPDLPDSPDHFPKNFPGGALDV